MQRQVARFLVNGSTHEIAVRPYDVLLDVLREPLNLTATKRGCDMGTCGCCTVLIDGEPKLSCLTMALEVAGTDARAPREVTTLEGIRDGAILDPLQTCWAEAGASQCGFCSPGFIISSKALLDRKPDASLDEIKEAISGNVCRCTGYTKILEAIGNAQKLKQTAVQNGGR
jgi:carbon-monoxide dehydrogenase small subunit